MTLKNSVNILLIGVVLAIPAVRAAEGDAAKTVGTSAGAPQQRPYNYKTPKLDRRQFDALLARPKELLIVDVRRPDELSKIGGFPVYLSIQSADLEKSLAMIPKDRTIVTVSNHAGRAGAAGDLLAGKGFKVAGAVGAQNYEEEGGTLAKIVPPPPKTADAAPANASKPAGVN